MSPVEQSSGEGPDLDTPPLDDPRRAGLLRLSALLVVILVRWFLGPLSYSVGTPGGLFAPLLVVGALLGSLLAVVTDSVLPGLAVSSTSFAVVGMSTFFAAVVRAPITGVVLIMEMTAQTALVVPMVVGAVTAVVTATLLKGPPVYDTLRHRLSDHTMGSAA